MRILAKVRTMQRKIWKMTFMSGEEGFRGYMSGVEHGMTNVTTPVVAAKMLDKTCALLGNGLEATFHCKDAKRLTQASDYSYILFLVIC